MSTNDNEIKEVPIISEELQSHDYGNQDNIIDLNPDGKYSYESFKKLTEEEMDLLYDSQFTEKNRTKMSNKELFVQDDDIIINSFSVEKLSNQDQITDADLRIKAAESEPNIAKKLKVSTTFLELSNPLSEHYVVKGTITLTKKTINFMEIFSKLHEIENPFNPVHFRGFLYHLCTNFETYLTSYNIEVINFYNLLIRLKDGEIDVNQLKSINMYNHVVKFLYICCSYMSREGFPWYISTESIQKTNINLGYFTIQQNSIYNIYVEPLYRKKGVLKSMFSYIMKNMGNGNIPNKLICTTKNSSVKKQLGDYGFKKVGTTFSINTSAGEWLPEEMIYTYNFTNDEILNIEKYCMITDPIIWNSNFIKKNTFTNKGEFSNISSLEKFEDIYLNMEHCKYNVLQLAINNYLNNNGIIETDNVKLECIHISEKNNNKTKQNEDECETSFHEKEINNYNLNTLYSVIKMYPDFDIVRLKTFVFKLTYLDQDREPLIFMLPADQYGNLIITDNYDAFIKKINTEIQINTNVLTGNNLIRIDKFHSTDKTENIINYLNDNEKKRSHVKIKSVLFNIDTNDLKNNGIDIKDITLEQWNTFYTYLKDSQIDISIGCLFKYFESIHNERGQYSVEAISQTTDNLPIFNIYLEKFIPNSTIISDKINLLTYILSYIVSKKI